MSKLNLLLAVTLYNEYNIQTLHWKVKGTHFDCLHKLLEDYRDKFIEIRDTVGEMIISCDEDPIELIPAIKLLADTDETKVIHVKSDEYYDDEKVFECLGHMLEQMHEIIDMIREDDSCNSPDIMSELDGIQYWLHIEGKYKNKSRLK